MSDLVTEIELRDKIERLEAENRRVREAIEKHERCNALCLAACGMVDPADGCRAVISHIEALQMINEAALEGGG